MGFGPASFSCSSHTSSHLLLYPKIPKSPFLSTTITPSLISITCLQRQRTPHFSSIRVTASKFNSNAVPAPNDKKSTKTTTLNPKNQKQVKEDEVEVEEKLPFILPGPRVGQISLDRKKFDPIYHNRLVNMLVNRVMKRGKKSLAYQIIYRAMKRIQQKTKTNPLFVLRQAIVGVTPNVGVKARRVGGSTHQVPIEIGSTQGKALAIRWLLGASRKRQGRSMVLKLSSELMDAAKGSGDAIRKKEEAYRMAEANRAFNSIKANPNAFSKDILEDEEVKNVEELAQEYKIIPPL